MPLPKSECQSLGKHCHSPPVGSACARVVAFVDVLAAVVVVPVGGFQLGKISTIPINQLVLAEWRIKVLMVLKSSKIGLNDVADTS